MAYDSLNVFQASVTKAASFNSTALDFGTIVHNATPNSMYAVVHVTTVTGGTGNTNTFKFTLEGSDDNATFAVIAGAEALEDLFTVAAVTTETGKIINIPFRSVFRYVRLVLTVSGSGTTPSITYLSYLSDTKRASA